MPDTGDVVMMGVNVAVNGNSRFNRGELSDHVTRRMKTTSERTEKDDTRSSSGLSDVEQESEKNGGSTDETLDEKNPKMLPVKRGNGSLLPSDEVQKNISTSLSTSLSKSHQKLGSPSLRIQELSQIGASSTQTPASKSKSSNNSNLSPQQVSKPALDSPMSLTKSRQSDADGSPSKLAKSAASPVGGPESIKHCKEVSRLKEILHETSALAAQQVLRDEWRTLLFDGKNDDHLSFILRAILKNSKNKPRVMTSALNDSNTLQAIFENTATIPKFLAACTPDHLMEHVPQEVLYQVAARIVAKAEATTLVRWLGEGGRLGYKQDDIIDLEDESVSPNVTPDEIKALEVQARPYLHLPGPQVRDPLLIEQERNLAEKLRAIVETQSGEVKPCDRCGATFQTATASAYHDMRVKCMEPPPPRGYAYHCSNCKQNFTGKGGWDYHSKTDCCGLNNIPNVLAKSMLANAEGSAQKQARMAQPSVPSPKPEPFHPAIRPPMRAAAPLPQSHSTPASVISTPSQVYVPTPPIPSSSSLRRFPSELSPREKAALDAELQQAENKYNSDIAAAQQQYINDDAGLARKLITIENGFASKKSQIRKKHGVTMRMRKSEHAARAANPNEIMMSSTPSHVSPPASFSPINGPNSGSKTRAESRIVPPPAFKQLGSESKAYVATHVLPPQQNTSSSSQQVPNGGSGNAIVPSMRVPSQNNHKRRSSDAEHQSPRPSGPNQTHPARSPWLTNPRTVSAPGLQMMEVRSEDAASKYTSKETPATFRTHVPRQQQARAPPTSDGQGTKESAIVLTDSDSETDQEAPPAPAPRSAPTPAATDKKGLAPSIERDDDENMGDVTEEEKN